MRTYKSLFFCALLFLTACGSKDKIPADILPKDRMTAVLVQVHIIDGKMYNISQMPDSLYLHGTAFYLAMFKKYHTDTVQFARSYKYYTAHPDKFDEIYDDVVKRMQTITDSIAKLKTKDALPKKLR